MQNMYSLCRIHNKQESRQAGHVHIEDGNLHPQIAIDE